MTKKRDNSLLESKQVLRRHFLDCTFKSTPKRVLDCFQGEGVIWGILRSEYDIAEYLGCDVKPGKARLVMDSARLLQGGGWRHNIIDLDAYGSPWKHWLAMLRTPDKTRELLVFLTIGQSGIGGGTNLGTEAMIGLGLGKLGAGIRLRSFGAKLSKLATDMMLSEPLRQGWKISECMEAPGKPAGTGRCKMRYIGLRLSPQRQPKQQHP